MSIDITNPTTINITNPSETIQEEGVDVVSAPLKINFVGDGVTAVVAGGNATVTIPLNIETPDVTGSNVSIPALIETGSTVDGSSGDITLVTGESQNAITGDVNISTGDSVANDSGDIILTTGSSYYASSGVIRLNSSVVAGVMSATTITVDALKAADAHTGANLTVSGGDGTDANSSGGNLTLRGGTASQGESGVGGTLSILGGLNGNATYAAVSIAGSSINLNGPAKVTTITESLDLDGLEIYTQDASGADDSTDITTSTGNTAGGVSGDVSDFTGDVASGNFPSGDRNVGTGDSTDGPSGSVYITTGSAGTTRGSINLDALAVNSRADIQVTAAGKGLRVKEGSNAKQGIVTLIGGTAAVSNTSVTANSRIMLTAQSPGIGTPGALYISARVASTSFAITSTSGTDVSVVAYQIFEPA